MTASSKNSYKRLTSSLMAWGSLLAHSSGKLMQIIFKNHHSKPLTMVPKGKQQMKKQPFSKIYENSAWKVKVCGIRTKTTLPTPPAPPPSQQGSRLLHPRAQGPLFPQLSVQGLSSWEEQDFGLLNPSPAPITEAKSQASTSKTGGSLLPNTDLWNRGSALGMVNWEYWDPNSPLAQLVRQWFNTRRDKLLWCRISTFYLLALSSYSLNVTHRKVLLTVPTPSSRTLAWIFCQGEKAGTCSTKSFPKGPDFIPNRVWTSLNLREVLVKGKRKEIRVMKIQSRL